MEKRLFVLVGIPGSGKTTFAMRYVRRFGSGRNEGRVGYTGKEKYVNRIGKDRVQELTAEQWDDIRFKVFRDVEKMLRDQTTEVIIYDETNTTEKYLLEALRRFIRINPLLSVEFFMFDDSLSEDLCKKRVAERDGRDVDADDRERDYFRRQAYKYARIRDLVLENCFYGMASRAVFIEGFQTKQDIRFSKRKRLQGVQTYGPCI